MAVKPVEFQSDLRLDGSRLASMTIHRLEMGPSLLSVTKKVIIYGGTAL